MYLEVLNVVLKNWFIPNKASDPAGQLLLGILKPESMIYQGLDPCSLGLKLLLGLNLCFGWSRCLLCLLGLIVHNQHTFTLQKFIVHYCSSLDNSSSRLPALAGSPLLSSALRSKVAAATRYIQRGYRYVGYLLWRTRLFFRLSSCPLSLIALIMHNQNIFTLHICLANYISHKTLNMCILLYMATWRVLGYQQGEYRYVGYIPEGGWEALGCRRRHTLLSFYQLH